MIKFIQSKIETNMFELKFNKLTRKDMYAVELTHNIQFSKVYSYLEKKFFEQFLNVEQLHDFVNVGTDLIKGPGYLFDITRYENLNYKYQYLPYLLLEGLYELIQYPQIL